MVMFPTAWHPKDLTVGRIVYFPPCMRVDPVTRQSTGELQKFRVTKAGGVEIAVYHGPKPADMPPERDVHYGALHHR